MAPPNFTWNDDLSLTRKGMGPLPQPPTPPAPTTPATPTPEAARTEPDPARYRLGSRLGRTGQVYEATSDRYPGRLIVKLMPFATGLSGTAVRAFTQEATRVAELRHPHIVPVMTAGIFADGTPFLAMEPLTGETLEERMARHRVFTVGEVLPVVRGLASALSAAHAAGVVHREVRADNVFISDLPGYGMGFARLLDFGVSRLTAAARDAGRIVAPAAWRVLAPEQQQGQLAALGDKGWQELLERADQRTDQFALAAMTYRLLTGTEPAPGQDVGTAFERVNEESSNRCPPAVDFVLCKALSRRPELRYDSMALFFRAFEEACATSRLADGSVVRRLVPRYPPLPDAPPVQGEQEDETRPAISGIEPVTEPAARSSADAPTVVSWEGPNAAPSASRSASGRRTATPVRATAPGALTQQFFADGDRQEAEWLKGMARRRPQPSGDTTAPETTLSTGTDDFLDVSASHEIDRADFVPRRRLPLMVGGIAVAVLGFVAVGWAIGLWSPGAWLADHTAPAFRAPAGERAAPVIPPPVPAATQAPAKPAPAPVAAAPAPAKPAPAPAKPAPAPAKPVPVAEPAPIAAEAAPAGEAGRKEPLRGMAWSDKRRRMIRSRLAPIPSESPPPPPMSGTPEVQVAPGWPPPAALPARDALIAPQLP